MKIVHVIESLDPSGCARQLQLLSPLLRHAGIDVSICCLGFAGAWADRLQQAGVAVHELRWVRCFDPGAAWRMRSLLCRLRPDLLHVWRRPALRAVSVSAPELLGRTILSAPRLDQKGLSWLDRQLLERVRCVALGGQGDAAAFNGGSAMVRPAACWDDGPLAAAAARARRIVCVGRLEKEQGFRDAIWALDILTYLYPDVELVIAGSGPERARLASFARSLHNSRHVRFSGAVANVAELFRSAALCWVPSQANVGRQVALEAMAQGCAVIANDMPCLREVIDDGRTGLLVPRGDVTVLARRSRRLLDDLDEAAQLGQAAAAWVRGRFAADRVADEWRTLYRRLAA